MRTVWLIYDGVDEQPPHMARNLADRVAHAGQLNVRFVPLGSFGTSSSLADRHDDDSDVVVALIFLLLSPPRQDRAALFDRAATSRDAPRVFVKWSQFVSPPWLKDLARTDSADRSIDVDPRNVEAALAELIEAIAAPPQRSAPPIPSDWISEDAKGLRIAAAPGSAPSELDFGSLLSTKRKLRGAPSGVDALGDTPFDDRWSVAESGRPPGNASRIQMTAFGPSRIRRRERFFIQAVFHAQGADADAARLACVVERDAVRAQILPLSEFVNIGDIVRVRLHTDSSVKVDEPEQSFKWRGESVAVQFAVRLPWFPWRRDYLFVLEVEVGGVPTGRCKFTLSLRAEADQKAPPRAYGSLSRYQYTFLSYASEDASKVADVAQLLEAQGLEYFLDQLSQRAGIEWREELKRSIERCDLFLLCWSRHAARSDWVRKEIRWALEVQRRNGGATPDIRPFLLEGPDVAPPPRELSHLHFNSPARLLKTTLRREL